MKVVLRGQTRDEAAVQAIRRRFGLPSYTTLNGETPGDIGQADKDIFDECVRRGFFTYRPTEWSFNGKSYSW